MIELIEHLDQQLFLFINSLHSSSVDPVMSALSGKLIWSPLYAAILIYIAIKEKKKFFQIILFIILAVLLADQGSVQIKDAVQRLRPCHEPSLEGMVHIVDGHCGGLYGFISSHAANAFNVALISLLFIRKKWYTVSIIIWAAVIGYTRIYLGVHYPGDILAGSAYGAFVGWGAWKLSTFSDKRIRHPGSGRKQESISGQNSPGATS